MNNIIEIDYLIDLLEKRINLLDEWDRHENGQISGLNIAIEIIKNEQSKSNKA